MRRFTIRDRSEKKGGGVSAVGLLLALPLLYVLSVGPVARLAQETGGSIRPIVVVYAPLSWATAKWGPAGDALRWYLDLWGYEPVAAAR